MISRRSLFLGAASLLAAPSIVRASSLMAIKTQPELCEAEILRLMEGIEADKLSRRQWLIAGHDAHGFDVQEVIADFSTENMEVRIHYLTTDQWRTAYGSHGA